MEGLPAVVTLLIALSVATERAVEIVKSLVPFLDTASPVPKVESRRRAILLGMAALFGLAITNLSWPIVAEVLKREDGRPFLPHILALGLLASGGSGFWNSLLTYTGSLKEIKRAEATERAMQAGCEPIPQPLEGKFRP